MKLPHPIPYQGSKRNLADQIMRFYPDDFDRLIEPFAGLSNYRMITQSVTSFDEEEYYYQIRDKFNETKKPEYLLFLLDAEYRPLQSCLLQCIDRSKPPYSLLILRDVTPAYERLSLSG